MAGDWNKSNTSIVFDDFQNLREVETPPTRGDEVLDIIFTNMHGMIVEEEICPPLVPNSGQPGRPSDHNIVVITVYLPRSRNFKWLLYSYRIYTEAGDKEFGKWIKGHD